MHAPRSRLDETVGPRLLAGQQESAGRGGNRDAAPERTGDKTAVPRSPQPGACGKSFSHKVTSVGRPGPRGSGCRGSHAGHREERPPRSWPLLSAAGPGSFWPVRPSLQSLAGENLLVWQICFPVDFQNPGPEPTRQGLRAWTAVGAGALPPTHPDCGPSQPPPRPFLGTTAFIWLFLKQSPVTTWTRGRDGGQTQLFQSTCAAQEMRETQPSPVDGKRRAAHGGTPRFPKFDIFGDQTAKNKML